VKSGAKSQISVAGGTEPRWRANGRELFYLDLDNRVMAAEVNNVSADGQRFLVDNVVEQPGSESIIEGTMTAHIDRRRFLMSLPALLAAPTMMAQSAGSQIRVRGINHVSLTVSDLKRSVDFYQSLFGLRLRPQGAAAAQLVIGSGPEHLGLSVGGAGVAPRIDHYCLGVEDFNVDRILQVLSAHGVSRSEDVGPMKVHVTVNGSGTASIRVGDPDGIDIQLQDASYCSGSGALGNVCSAAVPSPKPGLMMVQGYSHCTISVTDAQRANAFHRQVFGFAIRSYQGPSAPTLAVGPGVEFLMLTAGAATQAAAVAAPPRPGINHFCLTVPNFDADRILKGLESYGIKPRETQTSPVAPMRHYVNMRMENRGGSKAGTPELYFTDPDGILVQLQDISYCGGSGVLGNVCPAP
jgi:catechol 2,3-dioxygenase-like lactoylglutathione lyase family enzyme